MYSSTGPTEMGEHIAYLSKHWPRPISVMPNAGLPVMVQGKTTFPLSPEAYTTAMAQFIDEFGVNIALDDLGRNRCGAQAKASANCGFNFWR